MQTRIALVGILVEEFTSTEKVNEILHEYQDYIVGRMGIPHAQHAVGVISVVLNAPNDVISALGGKIGMLPGVSSKTIYAKQITPQKEME